MSSLETLRRRAKALRKRFLAGDPGAAARVRAVLPASGRLKHAEALYIIAREEGFTSWPKLKFDRETQAMDRAQKAARLRVALSQGQNWVTEALLEEMPDLGREDIGLACALYDIEHVRHVLAKDPSAAKGTIGAIPPLCAVAFSRYLHHQGSEKDMLAVAEALLGAGADVDSFYDYDNDPTAPLSALYGAIGHSNNMALGRLLLERGANPNDNESLYHATELGHHEGLKMLLAHGANPAGTNALPRALDFNDVGAVKLLLDAGADPNEGIDAHPSGEPSFVIPALHQAVRRMCDPEILQVLLAAGADPSMTYRDMTPYSIARVYGNADAARMIEAAGGQTELSEEEDLLITAAEDRVQAGVYIDPAKLPVDYRNLLRVLVGMPGKLEHVKRLVALGLEWDRPDEMGMTPVQIAGWEGLPEEMAYFLSLKPDLSHINGYGGTLLSTIVHGSENCPARDGRDHVACARLALEEGVALPRQAPRLAGDEDMAGFLADWAEAYPGQVVEHGPV